MTIESKPCCLCKQIIPIVDFDRQLNGPNGIASACKSCTKIRRNGYYQKHKEKRKAAIYAYRKANPDKIRATRMKHYYGVRVGSHHELHKQKWREYENNRSRNDPVYRILKRSRHRLWEVLKRKGAAKAGKTVDLLGCTPEFLKGYLEAQFQPGWTWDDWGTLFEIDHRMPCSRFDMSDPVQQKECFHYTNLQPLDKKTNRSKWNKVLPEYINRGK